MTASVQSNCWAKEIQAWCFADHHRAGGGALVEAPRHLIAAASVLGFVDACAIGEEVASVLEQLAS